MAKIDKLIEHGRPRAPEPEPDVPTWLTTCSTDESRNRSNLEARQWAEQKRREGATVHLRGPARGGLPSGVSGFRKR